MAEQMRPASPDAAPDPARSYGRDKPEAEAGLGRLDNNMHATPAPHADATEQAVKNRQDGTRQMNAHEVTNQRREGSDVANPDAAGARSPSADRVQQPDHSMKDEEPLGWDQAPTGIQDPRDQRHPRTEGKGGTP
jgi:hypothetical protein